MPSLAASSPSCDHVLLSCNTRISSRRQSLHRPRVYRGRRVLILAGASEPTFKAGARRDRKQMVEFVRLALLNTETQDEAADANLGSSTRLRVERQTHLPLTREEAWRSLRMLAPSQDWKNLLKVFTALESVYR